MQGKKQKYKVELNLQSQAKLPNEFFEPEHNLSSE
jgi:hypothetical protein